MVSFRRDCHFESWRQFLGRNRGRSEFAHDHGAAVVRNLGRFAGVLRNKAQA